MVHRIRDAGGIILGKTNCSEFLASWESDNYITGRTSNPWNLDRTAGGSSGGEAAAIAAGLLRRRRWQRWRWFDSSPGSLLWHLPVEAYSGTSSGNRPFPGDQPPWRLAWSSGADGAYRRRCQPFYLGYSPGYDPSDPFSFACAIAKESLENWTAALA